MQRLFMFLNESHKSKLQKSSKKSPFTTMYFLGSGNGQCLPVERMLAYTRIVHTDLYSICKAYTIYIYIYIYIVIYL